MIYIKCFLFYARINDQCKTTALENKEKLVEQTVQALKSCWIVLGMCNFCTVCEITFVAGADLGGGCRGCAPSPEMTCGFLIQLVLCQKKNCVVYWF